MSQVIDEIVDQHVEEAAFLWATRDRYITAPHWLPHDLIKIDERIEAHLDGLRVAGAAGWKACCEALNEGEPGYVFAATVLALESGDEGRTDRLLEVGTESLELSRALISGLGWLPFSLAGPHIKGLLASEAPVRRKVGIAAAAIHRRDPGGPLLDATTDTDLLLRSRALRAIGELGRIDLLSAAESNLQVPDDECRFWAAWSGTLLGSRLAPPLRWFALPVSRRSEQAVSLTLRTMDLANAHAWQQELAQEPVSVRLAVIGAGAIGDPSLVPWLVEQMASPNLARIAGEAFMAITGVDLTREHLDDAKSEGFATGPTDNPEDEDVALDPDEKLPWPAADLIRDWWRQHQSEFALGTRYLFGKPITEDQMQQVLRTGRQRQRATAALELAIRHQGQPLFNVRAPAVRQQGLLGLG